jgi:hypothetical protein
MGKRFAADHDVADIQVVSAIVRKDDCILLGKRKVAHFKRIIL